MNTNYDILVNRCSRLSADYVPHDLIPVPIPFEAPDGDPKTLMRSRAAMAVKHMISGASYIDLTIHGVSGYRSYFRQKELYDGSMVNRGRSYTEKYLAPPGGSEHQTGLAIDVSCPAIGYELEEEFEQTKEGTWLRYHAPLYGFILRYPKGKEHITGYAYEPWHFRYVTKPLALYLQKTNITLEEYYGMFPK